MGLRLHKKFGPIVYYVKIIWVCNFINDLTPLWAMWNALTTIGDAFCLDRGADWQGWEKRVSPLGSSAWLWLNKSWVNCLVFYCKGATDIIRLDIMNILWDSIDKKLFRNFLFPNVQWRLILMVRNTFPKNCLRMPFSLPSQSSTCLVWRKNRRIVLRSSWYPDRTCLQFYRLVMGKACQHCN